MTHTLDTTVPAPAAAQLHLGAGRRKPSRNAIVPWVFLTPALAVTALVLIAPLIYTIVISVFNTRVSGGLFAVQQTVFVGFENFIVALTDAGLWQGFGNVIAYGLILAPVMLGLALIFALMLDSIHARLTAFSRVAIFLPYAVPGVIASIMWGFIYLPGVSPIGEAFQSIGLPAPNFFGGDMVFVSIANIGIWGGMGFNMLIMYTALRSIPGEIYDSARIDGCTEIQVAWYVKVRLITPALVLTGLFTLIAALQVYAEPLTMRTLANSPITPTFVPMMDVYNEALVENNLNGAAATAIIIALIAVISAGVVFGISKIRQARGNS